MLVMVSAVGCVSDTGPAPTRRQRTYEPRRRQAPPLQKRKPPSKTTARRPRPPLRNHVAGRPEWMPNGGRISNRWQKIVIHHSATEKGSAKLFDKGHRAKGWDELGYHFVIGNGRGAGDGQVQVGSRWMKQKHGAHCKTPGNYYNDHGIGICLVGDFTSRGPTARQLASLRQLVEFLCDRCKIPAQGITSHRSVTKKTVCPGKHFPLNAFRRSLATTKSTGGSGAR
jgi:N-acetylmuramoyl-L-alanine amidase